MLISLQDVPPYEWHLWFCWELDHARRTRPHGRCDCNVRTINRSLTVCHGQVADDRVPLATRLNPKPVVSVPQPSGWFAAALECVS